MWKENLNMALMNYEVYIFVFLIVISSATALIVAYSMFSKWNAPGAAFFGFMEVSCLFWNVGYIIEILGGTLVEKMIGVKIQYFAGIPLVPLFWAAGAISYVTLNKQPSVRDFILVGIIPLITSILALLMEYHGYFYRHTRLIHNGPFLLIEKDWGIWFYVHVIYSYFLNLVGSTTLFFSLKKVSLLSRKQTVFILVSIVLPWLANITYITGMKTFMRLDYTNAAFTFSTALLGWSIYKYKLFDLVPVAREAVIDLMKKGVVVLDVQNRIIDINPAAVKILENKKGIGENLEDFLLPLGLSKINLLVKNNLAADLEIGSKNFEVTVSEIKDHKKNIGGKIITFFDITDRKKIEKELNESIAAKDKFFSIIAHDLRNPFFGITGLAEILTDPQEEVTPEEREEMLNQIKELSSNTYRMLENLLEWSRSQTGKIEFKPDKINLLSISNETIQQLSNSAEMKGITLTNEIKEDIFAYCDANMIRTVLRNLISNAIKFTVEGGTIKVYAKKDENVCEVSVIDTGVGMTKETSENIFRIDKATHSNGTAGEKGSGLGVLLCKEFVEKNGGKIWVESTLGKGSTFYFTLPLNNQETKGERR
jgi:signal transduction histidine kinase